MTNPKISAKRMVLVPSRSRFDLSVERWKNYVVAKKRFKSARKWEDIVDSDLRQKENMGMIEENLVNTLSIDRSELTDEVIKDHDLFVFLGGDDHFSYCGQVILKYLKDNPESRKYVAGVVLDTTKSWGGILHFNPQTFLDNVGRLNSGQYKVENWTTLEATVKNGFEALEPFPAVWGYFVGEYCRLDMSRNDTYEVAAYVDGKEILPEKSSGVLVVTGAGSGPGSWYENVHQCYFDKTDEFGKSEVFARVIATENKAKAKYTLKQGETLILVSYNDARGVVSPDAQKDDHMVDFEMGSECKIRISELKLPVIKV